MVKNTAVYLRVSTEEQSKHWGVQAQLSSYKKYCRENKLAIAAVYTDIISGGTSNRPGFQQMLIEAKQKSFSVIVSPAISTCRSAPSKTCGGMAWRLSLLQSLSGRATKPAIH